MLKVDDLEICKTIRNICFDDDSLSMLLESYFKIELKSIENEVIKDNIYKLKGELKNEIYSTEFLMQFVDSFKKRFTEEEIFELNKIYESAVMKKLRNKLSFIINPIYGEIRLLIYSLIKEKSNL